MTAKTDPESAKTRAAIELVEAHSARNYAPLPVVIAEGDGAWVRDVDGRRYLDLLAAYGALNFGHRHPQLTAVAHAQLDRLTLTSRAFHNDQLGTFCAELAALAGMDLVLPMNTGAEAVETALKTARKWGYQVKGIPQDQAKIVVVGGNFHGRTITIVSFSDDKESTADFGPFTPGFVRVPYGDIDALRAVMDDETAAVLIEPIQGEGGVVIPPDGYLPAVRDACTEANVLMIADEIQSGLGRTGYTFACDHDGVRPDVYVLGKALGAGIVPLSAVVSRSDVLGVFRPGEHGSTFGGNPLACAIGIAVVRMIATGEFQQRATTLGERFAEMLQALPSDAVTAVRSRGLWAGIDLANRTGRDVCEGLLHRGILAKDAHEQTIRLAPPLVIEATDLEWAVSQLAEELAVR
jgi:ornithine--oxo-acid transaminase